MKTREELTFWGGWGGEREGVKIKELGGKILSLTGGEDLGIMGNTTVRYPTGHLRTQQRGLQ